MSIEKITIDNREIEISNAFGWMFKYKAQFGEDPALFLVPAFNTVETDESGATAMATIGFVRLANMTWAMAKQAHREIPEPATWIDRFENFEILDFAGDVIAHAVKGMNSEAKNLTGAESAPEEKKNPQA